MKPYFMPIDYFAKMEFPNVYHVYNRTNNHEAAFKEDANYSYFLERSATYLLPCLSIYAYCLMPTHFHFVVSIKENFTPQYIEEQFRCLLMGYTKAINKKYERNGSLWQPKFRRVWLKTELKTIEKICYVHHNPIHHGYAKSYPEWRYSSYQTLFRSTSPTQVSRNKVLEYANVQEWLLLHEDFMQNYIFDSLEK